MSAEQHERYMISTSDVSTMSHPIDQPKFPATMALDADEVLLKESTTKSWVPTRHLLPSQPPQDEAIKEEQFNHSVTASELWGGALDFAGRGPKRLKPRRTVDYASGAARWETLRKLRHGLPQPPMIYPGPSNMSNLLPPAAYMNDPATSICDVFIHGSINKERSPISVAKWAPDGRWCLTGNQMGQFTLWNGATFNFESLKQAHDHPIRSLAYSHSGLFFLSGDQGGILKYYTPTINNLESLTAHREAVRAISFSPNDEKFATGGDDGAVKIWNFGSKAEERVLSGHGWDVRCVDWHPSKGLIASGSKDMLVKFWDPRSGKDLSTLYVLVCLIVAHIRIILILAFFSQCHVDGHTRLSSTL